jgi:hypothetical protein
VRVRVRDTRARNNIPSIEILVQRERLFRREKQKKKNEVEDAIA